MRPGTKKLLSLLTIFLAVWFSLRFLFPLFSPFALGLILALTAEPMVSFLNKRLHVPRGISAGIGVSMTFVLFAMLVLVLCAFLARELRNLAGVLPDLEQTAQSGVNMFQSWLLSLASHTPQSIRPLLQENVASLFSNGTALLDQAVRYGLGLAGNLLSHVPDSALSLGTAIISGYMFSAKLPRIKRWLRRRIPKEKMKALLAAGKQMKTVLWRWLLAQIKLMGVTFTILVLGLVLLRIPYALVWAIGISLVDAFPILGTGTVLLPWSIVSLLQGNTPQAIGFLGIYVTISLTRSILEPRFLGRHLGLDPLVTLMVLYAGYKLWGIGGMVFAPLLTVTAIQLVPDRRSK